MAQSLTSPWRTEPCSASEISVDSARDLEQTKRCKVAESTPLRPGLKRVLLATDFSEPSLTALPLLSALVRSCGVELYIAHLITPEAYKSIPCDSIIRGINDLVENANVAMARLVRSEMLTGIPIAGTQIAQGTAEHLQKLVADHKIDLLALGIRGSNSSRYSGLGSFAASVLHSPPCPLLLS